MKKIVYVALMAFVLSAMIACGNKKAAETAVVATDSVEVVVDSVPTDSVVVDSVPVDSTTEVK